MLGRLVPVLLLVLVVAGCTAPAAQTPVAPASVAKAPLPRPDVQAPKFLAPVLLGTILQGSEPNVGVSANGTVYVSTPLALWRSDDAGKTFKPIGKSSCVRNLPGCPVSSGSNPGLKGGGDGAIAVAQNGTVWWAGLAGGADGAVPVQLSTDRGESWSKPFDAASKNSSDREWIGVNRSGSVFVQWRDFGGAVTCDNPLGVNCPAAPSGILTRHTDDGGATWSDSVKVSDDGHQGPIAFDPTSDLMFLPHVVGDDKLVVARSADGGKSWDNVKAGALAADTFQFPIASVDRAGVVYVTYATGTLNPSKNYQADRFLNAPSVWLIHSADHGATWSKPARVSPEGLPAVFPWIVAGDPGRVAISYYLGTQSLPMSMPNVWHVQVSMSTTADGDAPKFASSFVTDQPNHVGHICVVGSACFPAQDRSLLDFFEIRMLPDGSPVLAFVGDADVKMETVNVYATRVTSGTSLLEGAP